MRNLFCVASTGGLLPLSFQLLLKNLLGNTLMNRRKVLQWQRSNHRPDIEIDPLNGKHSAGVQLMNESRVGNSRGHASVGEANRVRNLH